MSQKQDSVVAIIPARYAATRFPGKLMKDLCGKSVILRTYEAAVATRLFDQVIVATDSDVIFTEISSHGGKAYKSNKEHASGSDRIAEVAAGLTADVIVNIQGDEPFIDQEPLRRLIAVFADDPQKRISLASIMSRIEDPEEINNPNIVKVVTDESGLALYFSRCPIPFARDEDHKPDYFRHFGVYAFRREALLEFTTLPPGKLESIEKLEQLRYLEAGHKIRMVEVVDQTIGIDTPEDLVRARDIFGKDC